MEQQKLLSLRFSSSDRQPSAAAAPAPVAAAMENMAVAAWVDAHRM